MSTVENVKTTKIYKEFSDSDREKWFTRKDKKFLPHIDTLYYCVYVDTLDWVFDSRKQKFIDYLDSVSRLAVLSPDHEVSVFEDVYKNLSCKAFMHFNLYKYHFSYGDILDVFVADSIPNKDTPPIFVQLRSKPLWIQGVKCTLDESLIILRLVLSEYGLSVEKIVENRIDYAFHTNYIQNPLKFFPDDKLSEMQISQFKRFSKEGYFYHDEVHCDYFTLGRRKSNNVFFRVYNKCKEVVEMKYKQFFIPIWENQGLISSFDRYVLENTFLTGVWSNKERFRCQFYLLYGQDDDLKKQISHLLRNLNIPSSTFRSIADSCVPDVTVICNIEFQCKRKFFYNISKSITDLHISDDSSTDRLYSLVEQTKSITNFLTSNIIRFVKYDDLSIRRSDRANAYWWDRLRAAKQFQLPDQDFADFCYSYESEIDALRVRQKTIKSLASSSAYVDSYYNASDDVDESVVNLDFLDFCMHMNDNDIKLYSRVKSKTRSDISSKMLKISKSSVPDPDLKVKKYNELFKYWLYGLFKKDFLLDAFYDMAFSTFSLDKDSFDVFSQLLNKYKETSNVDFHAFCIPIMTEVLKIYKETRQNE